MMFIKLKNGIRGLQCNVDNHIKCYKKNIFLKILDILQCTHTHKFSTRTFWPKWMHKEIVTAKDSRTFFETFFFLPRFKLFQKKTWQILKMSTSSKGGLSRPLACLHPSAESCLATEAANR